MNSNKTLISAALFVCLIAGLSFGQSDGPLESWSTEAMEGFLLEIEHGLSKYLMTANLTVESSPNAEVQFKSVGAFTVMKGKDWVFKRCQWEPEFIEGIPDNAERRVIPYLFESDVRELEFQGREFDVFESATRKDSYQVVEYDRTKTRKGFATIDLFDWPFHVYGSFDPGGRARTG